MKKNNIVALFLVAIFIFGSCGSKKGTPVSADHVKIPQDVDAVMKFDMAQIQRKAGSLKELAKSKLMNMLKKESINEMVDVEATIGVVLESVDMNQNVYAFAKNMPQNESYVALSFIINNQDKFKKIFDNLKGIKPSFKAEGDIQLANLAPFFPVAIGYKGKTGMILVKQPEITFPESDPEPESDKSSSKEKTPLPPQPEKIEKKESLDDLDTPEEKPQPKETDDKQKMLEKFEKEMDRMRDNLRKAQPKPKPVSEADLKKLFVQVFKTSDKEKLQDATFAEAEAKNYDISFWINVEKSANNAVANFASRIPMMGSLANLKGTSTTGISFENGEIVFESNMQVPKETADKYGNMLSKTGSEKLARTIPIKNVTTLFGFSTDMKALFNIVKAEKYGLESIESNIREYDLDMKPQEMFEMFDGNFVVAIGDIKFEKMLTEPDQAVEAVISFGVGRQDIMQKLLKNKNYIQSDKGKGVYEMSISGIKPYLILKGNNAYIATSESLKNDIVNGKGGANVMNLKNNVGGFYINEKLLGLGLAFSVGDEALLEQSKRVKEISVSCMPLKGNKLVSKGVVRFKENKNALVIILDMLQKAAQPSSRKDYSMR